MREVPGGLWPDRVGGLSWGFKSVLRHEERRLCQRKKRHNVCELSTSLTRAVRT